ncbi:MAG: hypothetical protein EXR75_07180 [Myxococcales bacterium]|nr:hypothetical protein [Myxococcales bacterium]
MMERVSIVLAGLLVVACTGVVTSDSGAGGGDASGSTGSSVATSAGGGTMASGGSTTSSGGGSQSTVGSTTGSASSTASSGTGGGACSPACSDGFTCCAGKCRNIENDSTNCGACGTACVEDGAPFCDHGKCGPKPCDANLVCVATKTCCGTNCCDIGMLCCNVPGPIEQGPTCVAPVDGTCPLGCPNCDCAAPETPIATPDGERPISELREGELVYSVHRGILVAVPITKTLRREVHDHRVVELELAGGRTLHISGEHPLADGRMVSDVRAGDELFGVQLTRARVVPYPHSHTYDILPASDTGTYLAGGALVGSTLFGRVAVPGMTLVVPR